MTLSIGVIQQPVKMFRFSHSWCHEATIVLVIFIPSVCRELVRPEMSGSICYQYIEKRESNFLIGLGTHWSTEQIL